MTEKDYLDPKGYWGDPAGNFRRMSGDSIGAFWSCLFSNFWVPAEGRSSKPFKPLGHVLLIRDWEGCTTGAIGLPNPNRRSVVKTPEFLRPYIYTGIPLGFPGTDSWCPRVKG